ncbi:hypothetical protein BJ684DRAFT_15943 [Piptocephalis cylindrospora]|uniref:SET domain-containing protein n=1 Tax=Piptocephalis cylindrospora TaxID=1907219 RepID=A0A4V1IY85_9FUNG|nr:hypothetical protein BJ684DRAFT_15943 [Piptocephalis cylindrospora]|eukprot:RKP13679.1 hypothetical protein BJ684DRAFT_15943 [Piptocephalis cylindrospora]
MELTGGQFDIRVKAIPGKGRGVVAYEDIPAGRLLLRDSKPYAAALTEEHLGRYCSGCFQRLDPQKRLRCSACRIIYYCSKEELALIVVDQFTYCIYYADDPSKCQRYDWSDHRDECPYWPKVPALPAPRTRMLGRMLRREAKEGKRAVWRSLHKSDGFTAAEEKMYGMLSMILKAILKPEEFPSSFNECNELWSMMETNCFCVMDDQANEIGVGLWLKSSTFNHSCLPSCTIVPRGDTLIIRSQWPICKGEEVTISYLDTMMKREDRIKSLQDGYKFTCTCKVCSDKVYDITEAWIPYPKRLESSEHPWIIPRLDFKWIEKIQPKYQKVVRERGKEMLETMYEGNTSTPDSRERLKEAMDTLGPILHPRHTSLVSAQHHWMAWCRHNEDWTGALEMAQAIASGQNNDPNLQTPNHPARANYALLITTIKMTCIDVCRGNVSREFLLSTRESGERAYSLLEGAYGVNYSKISQIKEILQILDMTLLSRFGDK